MDIVIILYIDLDSLFYDCRRRTNCLSKMFQTLMQRFDGGIISGRTFKGHAHDFCKGTVALSFNKLAAI
ncbi:hypothetical protein [Viridibacillus arvi]|uniref:hypothetical protein n=1 Tax=Viridibacillus arvi TaxID=263475 RepID=UPI0034CE534E